MVRFDQPCLRVSGAVGYFREHMAVGDYLTEEGQAAMVWFGRGAERLGLAGVCRMEHFENLCRGLHPVTGQRLTVRDKGAHRRVCYFGQISPPKDVSIAYLVGGDTRIAVWWQEAVRETLLEIEALAATRVRRAGAQEDRTTGNLVAAIVTHETSRALDPQLHTHLCLLNLTWDGVEERWKGLQPSPIYRQPGFLREVCYAKLAGRLREAGYELDPLRGVGFAIRGIPPELRTLFSKRRGAIMREAAAVGATTQAALQAIAGQTRQAKQHATAEQLQADWMEQAAGHMPAVNATIAAASGPARRLVPVDAAAVLAAVEAHIFERRSVVDERILLREALETSLGWTTPAELRTALSHRVQAGHLVRVGHEIASREALDAENEFLGWAEGNLSSGPRLGAPHSNDALDPGQARAVAELLASRSRITVLQGDAGTGKTTCLRAVVTAIEQAGGRVFGCAPSAGATDVLRRELTADAGTLQQFLVNESLQQRHRGRVVVVDEAGLISVRQMRDLCRLAEANDHRLLLVGDIKQHTSVEAGDALRCLQQYAQVPTAHLTRIRRQRDPALRRAVTLLARGDARAAFDEFRRLGAVREVRSETALHRAAAEDYVRTTGAGHSCLVISPVWSEIHAFTATVRAQLRSAGRLSGPDRTMPTVFSLQWTRAQHRRLEQYSPGDALTFHRAAAGFGQSDTGIVVSRETDHLRVRDGDGNIRPLDPRRESGFDAGQAREISVAIGDRLLIRANLKTHRLKNGDLVDVVGFAPDGGMALSDGRCVPAGFRQFAHGYATTSHSAQGKTVDRGILLLAESGIAAGNLQQAYVSNSRFRESQMIYTTDAAVARAAMDRSADRKLARELVEHVRPAPARNVFLAALYRLGRVVTGREQLIGVWGQLFAAPRTAPSRR